MNSEIPQQEPRPVALKGKIEVGLTPDGSIAFQVIGNLTDGEVVMLLEMGKLRFVEQIMAKTRRNLVTQPVDPRMLREGISSGR